MELISQNEAETLLTADPTQPISLVLAWLQRVIAQPHPDLGIEGRSVCPVVPRALSWPTAIQFAVVPFADLAREIMEFRDIFLARFKPEGVNVSIVRKVILVIVPDMPAESLDDPALLKWLDYYLAQGLKLTCFHPKSKMHGMHNPTFPSRVSPIPLLNIRPLVAIDKAFVVQARGTKEGDLLEAAYTRLFGKG